MNLGDVNGFSRLELQWLLLHGAELAFMITDNNYYLIRLNIKARIMKADVCVIS